MTIQVGTRVSFTQRTTYRRYLHTVGYAPQAITGTVVDLLPWTPCALALVEPDSGLMPRLVSVSELSVVEAQDDVADALAASDRPFEMLTDDYEFMRWAGDLGGVELT